MARYHIQSYIMYDIDLAQFTHSPNIYPTDGQGIRRIIVYIIKMIQMCAFPNTSQWKIAQRQRTNCNIFCDFQLHALPPAFRNYPSKLSYFRQNRSPTFKGIYLKYYFPPTFLLFTHLGKDTRGLLTVRCRFLNKHTHNN